MKKEELAKNFSCNIEKERDRLHLTQAEMAKALDLSLNAYKKIITGDTITISSYTMHRAFLLTKKTPFALYGYNDRYTRIMSKVMNLSESQLSFIDAVVNFEDQFHSNDFVTVLVPTGCMYDGMIYDSVNLETVNVSRYREIYGNRIDFAIKVTSNHLHPVYCKGDILLICQGPIRDGDTGIFINVEDSKAYIRKFHQTSPCILESVNGMGQNFTVNDNDESEMRKWIKFGYVLSKMRP